VSKGGRVGNETGDKAAASVVRIFGSRAGLSPAERRQRGQTWRQKASGHPHGISAILSVELGAALTKAILTAMSKYEHI
jgi:hypothetical protein